MKWYLILECSKAILFSFFLRNLDCKLSILWNGEVVKKFIIEHYIVKVKNFFAMFYFIYIIWDQNILYIRKKLSLNCVCSAYRITYLVIKNKVYKPVAVSPLLSFVFWNVWDDSCRKNSFESMIIFFLLNLRQL